MHSVYEVCTFLVRQFDGLGVVFPTSKFNINSHLFVLHLRPLDALFRRFFDCRVPLGTQTVLLGVPQAVLGLRNGAGEAKNIWSGISFFICDLQ